MTDSRNFSPASLFPPAVTVHYIKDYIDFVLEVYIIFYYMHLHLFIDCIDSVTESIQSMIYSTYHTLYKISLTHKKLQTIIIAEYQRPVGT